MARRIEPTFEKPLRATKRGKARKAASRKRKAAKKRGMFSSLIRFAVYWGTVLGLWGGIAVAGVFAFYAVQMPSADTWTVPSRAPDMRIVAADGTFLANRGTTGGKALRLEHMSPHIPQAVIAIEDHRFHAHFGFDPIGFARAMVINITTGARQG
ncbi:MAG: transglycosylase domain-containing protein, partial [Pseudomonadota bacterium]